MSDRYLRLVTLIVDICPKPLLGVLTKYAQKETGKLCTVSFYMSSKEGYVRSKLGLHTTQLDRIYTRNGVDEGEWDISLICLLLTRLFSPHLKQYEQHHIENIKTTRNDIQHFRGTEMSEQVYETHWNTLYTAISVMTKAHGGKFSELEAEINRTTTSFPGLQKTLIRWNRGCQDCGIVTRSITLGTNERNTKRGEKVIHFKTENQRLGIMRDNFKRTMDQTQNQPTNTRDIKAIQTKLDEQNRIVVTGTEPAHPLATIMVAVKEKNDFCESRSVEMTQAADWDHVDHNMTDTVVCKYPFGKSVYDKRKSDDIYSRFDDMLEGTKPENSVKILIVTEKGLLDKAIQDKGHEHEILREKVHVEKSVDENTTKKMDVLLQGCNVGENHSILRNLQGLADVSLKHAPAIDGNIYVQQVKKASSAMRNNNIIVLDVTDVDATWPIIKSLLSDLKNHKPLILQEPNDLKYIHEQSVIIIENFAGKYLFDVKKAAKWIDIFHILSAIAKEKYHSVIITSGHDKLQKCENEITKHPLISEAIGFSIPEATITEYQRHESDQKCGDDSRKELVQDKVSGITTPTETSILTKRFSPSKPNQEMDSNTEHKATLSCRDVHNWRPFPNDMAARRAMSPVNVVKPTVVNLKRDDARFKRTVSAPDIIADRRAMSPVNVVKPTVVKLKRDDAKRNVSEPDDVMLRSNLHRQEVKPFDDYMRTTDGGDLSTFRAPEVAYQRYNHAVCSNKEMTQLREIRAMSPGNVVKPTVVNLKRDDARFKRTVSAPDFIADRRAMSPVNVVKPTVVKLKRDDAKRNVSEPDDVMLRSNLHRQEVKLVSTFDDYMRTTDGGDLSTFRDSILRSRSASDVLNTYKTSTLDKKASMRRSDAFLIDNNIIEISENTPVQDKEKNKHEELRIMFF